MFDDFSPHVEDSAKAMAGNWKKFESFAWHDEPENADNWCIINTSTRDSGILAKSNESVIIKTLEKFPEDARTERHSHWAVGFVDCISVRVYDNAGNITPAFQALNKIACSLADYPVLDDEDYSRREYEATLENIENAGYGLVREDAPEDWVSQCFEWFYENNQNAVENRDDQGGYPSNEDMRACLEALGFLIDEDDE